MTEQNVFTIIFLVFTILTVKDVFFGASTKPDALLHQHKPLIHPDALDDTVAPYIGASNNPTVKVLYCHSCGYRQAFEDLARRLKAHNPKLNIIGEYHKPGWIKSQVANLVFLVKIGIFAMLFTRFDPFAYFQMETPRIWHTIHENKVAASVMTLLLASSIESNMMSTGAFEIYYNDMPIWSKLQTGRIPSYQDISHSIDSLDFSKNYRI